MFTTLNKPAILGITAMMCIATVVILSPDQFETGLLQESMWQESDRGDPSVVIGVTPKPAIVALALEACAKTCRKNGVALSPAKCASNPTEAQCEKCASCSMKKMEEFTVMPKVQDSILGEISMEDFLPVHTQNHEMASPSKIMTSLTALRAYCLLAHDAAKDLQGGDQSSNTPIISLIVAFGAKYVRKFHAPHIVKSGIRDLDEAKQTAATDAAKAKNKKYPYRHLVEDFRDAIIKTREFFPDGIGKFIIDRIEHAMKDGLEMVSSGTYKNKDVMMLNAKAIGLSETPHMMKKLGVSPKKYTAFEVKIATEAASMPVDPRELWHSRAPTSAPTTKTPTAAPTKAPTKAPTRAPTKAPTFHPCDNHSHTCDKKTAGGAGVCIKGKGTSWKCACYTGYECIAGCGNDHKGHTCRLTKAPTAAPTKSPTAAPTRAPTKAPTHHPCLTGLHGCSKSKGGICTPSKKNSHGWLCSCDRAKGYICTKGCSNDFKGHTCLLTLAPTSTPTKAPTHAPTSAPTDPKCRAGVKHNCHKGHGWCKKADNKQGWTCGCKKGYECIGDGCKSVDHMGHMCIKITDPPTSTPTSTPTSAPTKTPTESKTEIKAEVSLGGVSAKQFTDNAQTSFREAIAGNMKMKLKNVIISGFSDGNEEVLALFELVQAQAKAKIGGGGLKVKFEVHPPKDHVTKVEPKNLKKFLNSPKKNGFASRLSSNLRKHGATLPVKKIGVMEIKKEVLSINNSIKDPAKIIQNIILKCGNKCQHAGNLISAAECRSKPDAGHCITCVNCAMPKMDRMCAGSKNQACIVYSKAMSIASKSHAMVWQWANMMTMEMF